MQKVTQMQETIPMQKMIRMQKNACNAKTHTFLHSVLLSVLHSVLHSFLLYPLGYQNHTKLYNISYNSRYNQHYWKSAGWISRGFSTNKFTISAQYYDDPGRRRLYTQHVRYNLPRNDHILCFLRTQRW